jgi:hypothetical protein
MDNRDGAEKDPHADPYQDPYMATADSYATADPYAVADPYLLDAISAGTDAAKADVLPARQQTEIAADSSSTKKKWRRKVSWQAPPRLVFPVVEDVEFSIDIHLSSNSLETQARRAQRREQQEAGSFQSSNKGSSYMAKCTELMTELEAGGPIASTVLRFWRRLTDAESARFSAEFPEFVRYTKG